MRHLQMLVATSCLIASPASPALAQARDVGPAGGAGGGDFRIACEPGDAVVGFDFQATHVVTRLAPVCGKKSTRGTYGRPWIGTEVEGATIYKKRCDPGSVLNRLTVLFDNTPLVIGVAFQCLNYSTMKTNRQLFAVGRAYTGDKDLACQSGRVGVGVFGRAGTAIDALGLTCNKV